MAFFTRKPVEEKSSKLYETMTAEKASTVEKPSYMPVVSLVSYGICMGACAVALFAIGQPLFGVGFLILGPAPAVGCVIVAAKALPQAMGRRSPKGNEDGLGNYLGEGGDELVRTMSKMLAPSKLEALEAVREEEAEATAAWAESLPQGLVFEDVLATSDDGTRLHGHMLRCCPESERWVVFAHGVDGSWRNGLTFARRLEEAGYNLLCVELRAHGNSEGEWIGAGWLDRRDLVAWCRRLVELEGPSASIYLMGQSMGAASVLVASAQSGLPPQVKGCVADAAYTDFWNAAVSGLQTGSLGGRPMSAHPLLELLRLMLKHQPGGYDLADARPIDAIAQTKVPVLLIQGADDQVVPAHMGNDLKAAADAAGRDVELLMVPAAGHCTSVFADPYAYYDKLLGFLGRFE